MKIMSSLLGSLPDWVSFLVESLSPLRYYAITIGNSYWIFGGAKCPHLQSQRIQEETWRQRQYYLSKRQYLFTNRQGVTAQKTWIISTSEATSNLAALLLCVALQKKWWIWQPAWRGVCALPLDSYLNFKHVMYQDPTTLTSYKFRGQFNCLGLWKRYMTRWHNLIFWTWRMKDQLDVTCYFISLIMCSTCFGH